MSGEVLKNRCARDENQSIVMFGRETTSRGISERELRHPLWQSALAGPHAGPLAFLGG